MNSIYLSNSHNIRTVLPNIFHLLSGRSQLPIYELDYSHVDTRYSQIRPFEHPRGFSKDPKCLPIGSVPEELKIRAWDLAIAVKKADLAQRLPQSLLVISALGFMLENLFMFNWNQNNLRLQDGMASLNADFSRTSLSGRFAQGVSCLFMDRQGYPYMDRFSSFINREQDLEDNRNLWSIIRARYVAGLPQEPPDYIFENRQGEVALVESKGGFVGREANDPKIKTDLKRAISQLTGWDYCVIPSPRKTYAIGTYIREAGDNRQEPSLVAFVDPEDDNYDKERIQRNDMIRRANYSAWLFGMGNIKAASRLLKKGHDTAYEGTERKVSILEIDNTEFAFIVAYVRKDADFDVSIKQRCIEPWLCFGELPLSDMCMKAQKEITVGITGLHYETLVKVSSALNIFNENPLFELEPLREIEFPLTNNGVTINGSNLSDGAFIGEITFDTSSTPHFRTEMVWL